MIGFVYNSGSNVYKLIYNVGLVKYSKDNSCIKVKSINDPFDRITKLKTVLSRVDRIKTVQILVAPPECTNKCSYCYTFHAGLDVPATSADVLDKWLKRFIASGYKISITFSFKEPLMRKYMDWQMSMKSVIEKYKENVSLVKIYTNSIELTRGIEHSLLTLEGVKTALFMSVSPQVNRFDLSHYALSQIEPRVDYVSQYRHLDLRIHLLFDSSKYTPKNDIEWIHKYDVKVRPVSLYGIKVNEDEFIKTINDWVTVDVNWSFDRLSGIYSLYSGIVDYDIAAFPRICLLDSNVVKSIVSRNEYHVDDIDNTILKIHLEEYPEFNKCSYCDEVMCKSIIQSGQCKAGLKNECIKCAMFGQCSGFYAISSSFEDVCRNEYYTGLFAFSLACQISETHKRDFEDVIRLGKYKNWRFTNFGNN